MDKFKQEEGDVHATQAEEFSLLIGKSKAFRHTGSACWQLRFQKRLAE